ncbi:ATP-grasp ribosomal peptide maturase [Streptomyces longwoodensis]|uniref:ATP-grasp ribosomal peptide maturase n=1 Tax=Streptomyces lasalocidi TaxID=324833 RepID=A0A4U5WQ00_STRLS|nr:MULTISPECIES: ATP-grasp ribosomal peptide maturase [Streptomyces]MCX4997537.1 ATP-grasp ribosomal peptide maturase [Streptomyces longwoodensis]TKT04365.1 ATP-grasp ribosomal peptide maturase [Streptomyces lasalocidi]WRY92154.1 ATP-grasp ribosomal peptide maturase [Streptomyces longwoodensis]WTI43569.1 ATP-grasp ribosomal peptide maturase [Streptomyces longwoodensis]WUC56326.1 ATP-grasp ribosomal peptide maturase [Streptomyces longwoodensis]
MTVLILTSEEDVTADMVVVHLNASGVPVVRLDPADLTGGVALSGEYVHGAFRAHLWASGRLVGMEGLRSVWVRRPGVPASRVPEPSGWLSEESSQALYGMLRGTDARWMNHPDASHRARHKPWQLRLAQRCGLPVPATLITTFPQAARDFAARFPDLVVKPVSGAHPQEPPRAVPTSRVAPDTDFTAVAFGPTLLQRRVAKRADVRLTAVGERLLAARKATPPDADPDEVDVRFASAATPWTPVEVPARVAEGVRDYLRQAELAYGAFDFAEDADGTWWFLECNQSGQFGFVEVETGQPIARTIAEWLAGREPEAGTACGGGTSGALYR